MIRPYINAFVIALLALLAVFSWYTDNKNGELLEANATLAQGQQTLRDALETSVHNFNGLVNENKIRDLKNLHALELQALAVKLADKERTNLNGYRTRLDNAALKNSRRIERRINDATADVLRRFEAATDRSKYFEYRTSPESSDIGKTSSTEAYSFQGDNSPGGHARFREIQYRRPGTLCVLCVG